MKGEKTSMMRGRSRIIAVKTYMIRNSVLHSLDLNIVLLDALQVARVAFGDQHAVDDGTGFIKDRCKVLGVLIDGSKM